MPEQKRGGVAFDHLNPGKDITDPTNLRANPDLPAHLYPKDYPANTYVEVKTDAEKQRYLKKGYLTHPPVRELVTSD